MRKSFLLRASLLLSLLCVCARVYVELKGLRLTAAVRLQKHTLDLRDQKVVAVATDAPADSASTSCRPLKHHRRIPRWKIDLEPWAAETRGLQEEASRFLGYISTPQVSCERASVSDREDHGAWVLCLDRRFSLAQRIASKHCRVYSLRLGAEDEALERLLSGSGCEVHCFDPSIRRAHLQDAHMWLHRLSVDWRDPNPAVPRLSSTKKLAAILNDFGHRQVDVLKVDLEGAEWKVLENLVLEEVLDSIGLLLLELHLHWAGFEVGGDEPAVVRYWFSLLRELERAHFRLYHSFSDPGKPRLFLHRNLQNASSSFVLGWVNTQFVPQSFSGSDPKRNTS